MQFETLAVSVDQHIATVKLNRPEKANAMNWQMWQDIRSAMQWADRTPEVRVVIVEGEECTVWQLGGDAAMEEIKDTLAGIAESLTLDAPITRPCL